MCRIRPEDFVGRILYEWMRFSLSVDLRTEGEGADLHELEALLAEGDTDNRYVHQNAKD